MPSQNYNEGKPRPSLILKDMPNYFNELVKVREMGCIKYSRNNWAESIGTEEHESFLADNMDSILRHVISMAQGETHDPESGLSHAAHIGIRCGFDYEYGVNT